MVDEKITSLSYRETGNIGFATEVGREGNKTTRKRMEPGSKNNLHGFICQRLSTCL